MRDGERILEILLVARRVKRFAPAGGGWHVEWTMEGGHAAWAWRLLWVLCDLKEPGRVDELLAVLRGESAWPRDWEDAAPLRGFFHGEFLELDPLFDRDLWHEFMETCVSHAPLGPSGIL